MTEMCGAQYNYSLALINTVNRYNYVYILHKTLGIYKYYGESRRGSQYKGQLRKGWLFLDSWKLTKLHALLEANDSSIPS